MIKPPKQREFPKGINEGNYTFLFESIHNSKASAKSEFERLLRVQLPSDAKYRVLRIDDRFGLYTW